MKQALISWLSCTRWSLDVLLITQQLAFVTIIQGQITFFPLSLSSLFPSLHHVLTPCYSSFSLSQAGSIWFSAVHQHNLVLVFSRRRRGEKNNNNKKTTTHRREGKRSKAVTQTDGIKLEDGGERTGLFWTLKIFVLLIWVMAASLKESVAFLTSRWSHALRPPARPKFVCRCCFQFRCNFEVDPSVCAKALVRPLSCYGGGYAAGVRELWKGSKHRTAENSSAFFFPLQLQLQRALN